LLRFYDPVAKRWLPIPPEVRDALQQQELARLAAEAARAKEEQARQLAETARAKEEQARQLAETARAKEEQARQLAEADVERLRRELEELRRQLPRPD
jgi:hypothetical protein